MSKVLTFLAVLVSLGFGSSASALDLSQRVTVSFPHVVRIVPQDGVGFSGALMLVADEAARVRVLVPGMAPQTVDLVANFPGFAVATIPAAGANIWINSLPKDGRTPAVRFVTILRNGSGGTAQPRIGQ